MYRFSHASPFVRALGLLLAGLIVVAILHLNGVPAFVVMMFLALPIVLALEAFVRAGKCK